MRRAQYHPLEGKIDSSAQSGLVAIARITRTRGLRGEVVAQPLTTHPSRFADVDNVCVELPGGERLGLKLQHHWFQQNKVILEFAGFDSIDRARQLIGGILKVREEELVALDADEFFHFQLIDCDVVTSQGNQVGRVIRIMETGSASLLVVRADDDEEYLIPFVESICPVVDIKQKCIRIDPPDGLLEL